MKSDGPFGSLQPVPRLALKIEEAALAIGVSPSTFQRHVLPNLKIDRIGGCRVIPVTELQRYVEREAR